MLALVLLRLASFVYISNIVSFLFLHVDMNNYIKLL